MAQAAAAKAKRGTTAAAAASAHLTEALSLAAGAAAPGNQPKHAPPGRKTTIIQCPRRSLQAAVTQLSRKLCLC